MNNSVLSGTEGARAILGAMITMEDPPHDARIRAAIAAMDGEPEKAGRLLKAARIHEWLVKKIRWAGCHDEYWRVDPDELTTDAYTIRDRKPGGPDRVFTALLSDGKPYAVLKSSTFNPSLYGCPKCDWPLDPRESQDCSGVTCACGAWVPLPDRPYPQDDRSWDDVWEEGEKQ